MVREFKDEPFVLLWILGNENNYQSLTHTNASDFPEVYADFVNEAARLIHKLDPHHPVCLSNGETAGLAAIARRAPAVDIVGLNVYREGGFGELWKEVAQSWSKPVLLTEYGQAHPSFRNGDFDEEAQARAHRVSWLDIQGHAAGGSAPGNALGGFAFEWTDEWWFYGSASTHDLNPANDGWNIEYMGLTSQGDGTASPFLRQLRRVYYTYQSLWRQN